MREASLQRLTFVLSLGLAAAAVAVPAAAAKNDVKLTITPPLSQVKAGSVWHATLRYTDLVTGKRATNVRSAQVILRNPKTGAVRSSDAYSYDHPGVLTTTLRLPMSGNWTLTIDDGEPYAWDSESKPFAIGGGGNSFPILPVTGGIATALLLGVLFLVLRHRRDSGSFIAPEHA